MAHPIIQTVPTQEGNVITYPTEIDLSALLYKPVKVVGSLIVAVAEGEMPIGILQNAPKGTAAQPDSANVAVDALAIIKVDGTVLGGDFLKVGSAGAVVKADADGDNYFAQVLDDAEDGDAVACKIVNGTLRVVGA